MFTGLIEEIGIVESVNESPAGREISIRSSFTDLADGESIAVNGACLTVREFGSGWFEAAAVLTTLERTTIGDWHAGTRVNLERSVRAADRLGGHLVQGHVDGVGTVVAREMAGDALLMDLTVPVSLEPLFVLHGSIAVDGVSLTVNELKPRGVQLSLIEYTLRHTTLGDLQAGSRVHIEADIIAKHVRRLLEPHMQGTTAVNCLDDFSLEH